MNHTIYETTEDLDRERLFMNRIEERFKVKCAKTNYKEYFFDVVIHKHGDVRAFGELKTRNILVAEVPTVICGSGKIKQWEKIRCHFGEMATPHKQIPFVLFVRALDGDWYCGLDSSEGLREEKWSALNHASDPLDTEWVMHIPSIRFKNF